MGWGLASWGGGAEGSIPFDTLGTGRPCPATQDEASIRCSTAFRPARGEPLASSRSSRATQDVTLASRLVPHASCLLPLSAKR